MIALVAIVFPAGIEDLLGPVSYTHLEVKEAVAANLSILKSTTVLRQYDGRMWNWEGSHDNWALVMVLSLIHILCE